MYKLSLGIASDLLPLGSGPSYTAPVKSSSYKQTFSPADTVEDIITVSLQSDSPADILTFITQLDEIVSRVTLYNTRPVVDQSVVIYQQKSSDPIYKSLILSIFYDPLGLSVEEITTGSLHIKIHLIRPNFWLGPEQALPLSNGNASHVTTPLTIFNHDDSTAGHDNFVSIDADDVVSDLPCPMKINIVNATASDSLRNLYAFLNINSNPLAFSHVFEAESGTGGTTNSSSFCSGGSYKTLTWSTLVETLLLTWVVTSSAARQLNNNTYKFLLRQSTPFIYTNLWLKLKFSFPNTSNILGETDWILVKPNETLQEFPPIQLPPCNPDSSDLSSPFSIHLFARCSSSGTHIFEIDFLHLYPLDGYLKAEALVSLNITWQFLFNSYSDLSLKQPTLDTNYPNFGFFRSHVHLGSPFFLYPNKPACIYFLQDINTSLSPIDRQLTIQAWYSPLKRFI